MAAILLLAAVIPGGCDGVGPRHDTAVLEIDSDDGSPVRIITSPEFAVSLDDEGQEVFFLYEADTTWVDVPFSGSYDLTETGRFYGRAMESENPEAIVTMRVLLDGDQAFLSQGVLTGEGIQYYYRTF